MKVAETEIPGVLLLEPRTYSDDRGFLFGAPFANLLFAALYLTLRDGADVPRANTTTMVGRPRTT